MRISQRSARVVAVALVLVSLAPSVQVASAGYTVTFPRPGTNDTVERYNDTVFVGLAPVNAVAFAENGDVWYAAFGGVVHERLGTGTRQLFTRDDGLPESVALDLSVAHGKVYVGTDLGLAIIDEASGAVTAKTPDNSPLPDPYAGAVATLGDQVWVGTGAHGIAVWNTTTDQWFVKNTSTSLYRPEPVMHFNVEPRYLWAATDGDGGWRFDRANGVLDDRNAWMNVTTLNSRIFNDHVLSVQDLGGDTYFATRFGIARWRPSANGTTEEWSKLNATNGLPNNQVDMLHVVPNADGIPFLVADTRDGVWRYEPQSGSNSTLAQPEGLFGSYVANDAWSPDWGWAFATSRGVSLLRGDAWTYFTTGPGTGASNGPDSYRFTSGGTGDSGSFLWFGRPDGLTAYKLPKPGSPGRFWNFGAFDRVPGGPVTWLSTDGTITWFATMNGAYGYDQTRNAWIGTPWTTGISYGVDAQGGELWIAAFGDGVYKVNKTPHAFIAWNLTSAQAYPVR